MIKFGDKIEKFGLFQNDDLGEKEFYFYTHVGNQIAGWKVVGNNVAQIWNFEVRNGEQIIKI